MNIMTSAAGLHAHKSPADSILHIYILINSTNKPNTSQFYSSKQDRSQVQQEHNMLKIPFLFYIPSNGFLISVFMNFSPPVIHIFQLLSITLFVYRLFPGWSFTPWQPKSLDHWAPAHVMMNAHERPSPKQLENRKDSRYDMIWYIYITYLKK